MIKILRYLYRDSQDSIRKEVKHMNEYRKQAIDFLEKANATCKIEFGGTDYDTNWNDKELRNFYHITLSTQDETMKFKFWDSIHNTEVQKRRMLWNH